MCNRIAENAEANWRIDISCNSRPVLKIRKCIALGRLHVLYVIPNEVRDLTQIRRTFLVFSVIQSP